MRAATLPDDLRTFRACSAVHNFSDDSAYSKVSAWLSPSHSTVYLMMPESLYTSIIWAGHGTHRGLHAQTISPSEKRAITTHGDGGDGGDGGEASDEGSTRRAAHTSGPSGPQVTLRVRDGLSFSSSVAQRALGRADAALLQLMIEQIL